MTTLAANVPTVKAARHRAPRGGCKVDGKFYRGGCYCRPFDADNPHERPTIEAKGCRYFVEAIDAGECGVAAVRLVKLSGHEAYDVIRRHDGLVECDCPDFLYRHEGKGTCCKHATAAMVHGLLPVAPVAELAPEIETGNVRDSWGPETDAEVWELGPDADTWTTEATPDDLGPAPSWDAERFEPEDIAAAYEAGYQLGLSGDYPRPPAHYGPREAHHFQCGRLAGFIASPDGLAWQDDMRACRDRVLAESDAPRESDGYAPGYCS